MAKKYIVRLSEVERAELQEVIRNRSAKSIQVKRAYVLLAADSDGANKTDEQIKSDYQMSLRSIERLRQRYVSEGMALALTGKKREVYRHMFDGSIEAHLVALRCSSPPDGHAHWTLRLLADRMVELEYVEHISHESVRQVLKKTNSSPGRVNAG